ncbi:N-acetylmuramoyl-L-alanine amidase [Hazenella sp. IB182357]|uniref:N-acetylmuramoyl-L-alanine amidase n=1 Tax=Polycladospora coralii TaxID=2771432 RepID=A0A926N5E5_9BACL|nr:N-acetylmuramoyl-L-alanine amidase [Polycladospora coralii]MBD1370781.1 N-acetylmuramoyl-L-alanine amidase [Polycladospora coralii]MBS7529719.1 N-acetylmuramoyl-L-alanine amidase [Polycladospora coralii]
MIIGLDPGDSNSDQTVMEKEIKLDITKRLKDLLEAFNGVEVLIMNVEQLQTVDLLISIHSDDVMKHRERCFTSFVSVLADGRTRRVQCWLHNFIMTRLRKYQIIDNGKRNDTELETGKLEILRHIKVPAIALTVLQMKNKSDQQLLMNEEFRAFYAQAIADGIANVYQYSK